MNLARRVLAVSPSATLAITAQAKALRAKGESVINFAAGEPDFNTPVEYIDAAIAAARRGETKYTPSIGTPVLREAICAYLARKIGLTYKSNQVMASNGAKHSLYNAIQAICDQDDEVLLPAPYWVSYPEMVKLAGGKTVLVPMLTSEHFQIKECDLESAVTSRTVAIIINSPCNPTGAVYTRDTLKLIAQFAEKHDLWVISDEVYCELVYDGLEHVSIASLGPEAKARTIVINAVSKTFAMTGWRIGYLATEDAKLFEALNNLQDHSTSNPSTLSQAAAARALTGLNGADDPIVGVMKSQFARRRGLICDALGNIPRLKPVYPQGTFYCFVDVRGLTSDTNAFALALLQNERVAVIPGDGFGAPGFIRLSFALGEADIIEGVARFAHYIRRGK